MAKKYFWLKLKDDFFRDKRIKKLRRIAGGDTYTLIYLKMQLLSLKNEGILIYEQVEDSFYEEIALEIDENEDNVKFTIMFLTNNGLLEEVDENKFALIETMNSIGSESQAAERVRKHREIKKNEQKALQCNTSVTSGNTEIELELELEKEIKLELELKKEKPMLDKPSVTELDVELELEFDDFYKLYPKKVEKKKALISYKKVRKKYSEQHIINGLLNYIDWIKLNGTENKYIKGPAVYLNGENFNDEYDFSSIKQNKNKSWGEILNDRRANGSDSRRDIHTLPELLG